MIKIPTLSEAFSALLNVAAKTQPHIDTGTLEGRSLCVAIDELPQDVSIRIEAGRVVPLAEDELPDVTISGSLKAIIYMISHENDGLENDDLYIAGKIGTARQFQHFLASFSLDWQAFFNQFMPEGMASKTAEAVQQGLHVARGGVEELGQRVKDYVINDKQWLVTQPEFEQLREGIADFNHRLDVLLNRLDNRR